MTHSVCEHGVEEFLHCDECHAEIQQNLATAGKPSALDMQVSGSHYKDQKIQPIEYIHANNIPFAEGCVIKYVSRWRQKGGIKDLEKARHFLDLLIELETRNPPPHDSLADRISRKEQA
ncbi:DUF3310 domain-containing protein [Pseudomonas nitroreducens]|uniref:DUF3310 domain-containing protein n=1 Tax=Pseudomonas nitroreducens TaxID=46680 RepID=UPI00351D0734